VKNNFNEAICAEGMTMRAVNPLKGLLLYLWYYAGGKLIILNIQAIVWGILHLFFNHTLTLMLFGLNAIAGATFILMAGMGNKEIDWERFQLSMPVRRSDLAKSQYLSVGIVSLIGIPIYIAFVGLSTIWHENVYFTLSALFISIAPFLSIPYILGGLVFPLYSIPALDKLYDSMFPVSMIVSIAIPQLVIWGASRLGWSMIIASFLLLAVAMLIFVVSYFITRKMYAKIDF